MLGTPEAMALGVVQGLTEFLPISSSAHLRIFAAITGHEDPGAAFTAVTQLGTETAVIVYFWRQIWHILRAWTLSLFRPEYRGHQDARLGWFVILGSLPIGILGLLLQNPIEGAFRDLRLIGAMLIAFGLVLGYADARARNEKPLSELNPQEALLYGLAQALALVPGVSRSGGTISGGLLMGYTREAAARYSFLLAIPAVLSSGIFQLKEIGAPGQPATGWFPTLLATVIAFGVGLAVIAWFLRYLSSSRHSFRPFVIYRVLVGAAVLVLAGTGVLPTGP